MSVPDINEMHHVKICKPCCPFIKQGKLPQNLIFLFPVTDTFQAVEKDRFEYFRKEEWIEWGGAQQGGQDRSLAKPNLAIQPSQVSIAAATAKYPRFLPSVIIFYIYRRVNHFFTQKTWLTVETLTVRGSNSEK